MTVLDMKTPITYDAVVESEVEKTYSLSYEVTENSDGIVFSVFSNLVSGSVAEVQTITITAGTAGDIYTVNHSTFTDPVSYVMQTGDTATDIAAALAAVLNSTGKVEADSTAAVITVQFPSSANQPLLTVTGSTTTGNLVIATTTGGSGTAAYRKINQFTFSHAVVNNAEGDRTGNGKIQYSVQAVEYNGASSPTPVVTGAAQVIHVNRESLDQKQTNQNLS